MDIRTTTLLGAIAAAGAIATAHAAPAPASTTASASSLAPDTYTELLRPVADPVAQLTAHDAALRGASDAEAGGVVKVDDYQGRQRQQHHHHHHHNSRSEYRGNDGRRGVQSHHHHHHRDRQGADHSRYQRHGYPPRHHHHHQGAHFGVNVSG